MIDNYMKAELTPSVHFNFEQSNLKSDRHPDFSFKSSSRFDPQQVPFEYSDTNYKNQRFHDQESLQTPPHSYITRNQQIFLPFEDADNQSSSMKRLQVKRTLDFNQLSGKVDTEQFFDDFQNNFVVKFGDSPIKIDDNLDFKKKQSSSNESSDHKNQGSKIQSNISEPLPKGFRGSDDVQNEEVSEIEIEIQQKHYEENKKNNEEKTENKYLEDNKENLESQKSKIQFEIRKRVLFKNQQNLANKNSQNKTRPGRRLINSDNLMIVTSSGWGGWTGIPQTKKWKQEARSQPIKGAQKTMKKHPHNIFSSHQMFKQTLRSTTLDNWRKKFTVQKTSLGKKNKIGQNIFQRPFGIR